MDWRPQPGTIWNRLRPEETEAILVTARAELDKSPREIACWVSDYAGFSVSESSLYRVLKLHGLMREVNVVGLPVGPEMHGEDEAGEQAVEERCELFLCGGLGFVLLDLGAR